jgi:hypothetical protein
MCQSLEGLLGGDSAIWTMEPRKDEEDIWYVLFTGWDYICLSLVLRFYTENGASASGGSKVKPRRDVTIQYNTMFSILGVV